MSVLQSVRLSPLELPPYAKSPALQDARAAWQAPAQQPEPPPRTKSPDPAHLAGPLLIVPDTSALLCMLSTEGSLPTQFTLDWLLGLAC